MVVFGLLLGGTGAILLISRFWLNGSNQTVAVGLVLVTSVGLSLATGGVLSVLLLAVDLLLVVVTWQLARTDHVHIVWIIVLVLILLVTKLLPFERVIGPTTWIGISYLILRLIHVMMDGYRGRLGEITLPEMIVYALHPTTLIAGPIDRIQHSAANQRRPSKERAAIMNTTNNGLWRLFIGLLKKLVLANLLFKVLSVYDMVAYPDQPTGIAWFWVICYSFYIYFDFAAYSDLAIGSALLMGISLPENFASPYLQPNIAQFWQAWHISLSAWLRNYIFFPLSRGLLKRYGDRFAVPIHLISHLVTMIACGLWHRVTLGFVVWGIWHGLGLFAYSQVSALRRRFLLPSPPRVVNIAITYSFVTVGWVFFAAGFGPGLKILARMFGIR